MQLPLLPCAFVVTALCGAPCTAVAQYPQMPGLPVTAPPTSHPALAAQLGMQRPQPTIAAPAPQPPAEPPPLQPVETKGVAVAGKALKRAVAAVNKLSWHDSLAEARVQGGAHGKPILLLQSLGDLEGFA